MKCHSLTILFEAAGSQPIHFLTNTKPRLLLSALISCLLPLPHAAISFSAWFCTGNLQHARQMPQAMLVTMITQLGLVLQAAKQQPSPKGKRRREQQQQQQSEQINEAELDRYGQADGLDEDALSQAAEGYSEEVGSYLEAESVHVPVRSLSQVTLCSLHIVECIGIFNVISSKSSPMHA